MDPLRGSPAGPTAPGVEIRCLPWPQRLVWSLWHAPRDLRRRPVDVFHGVTGFELPPRGAGALVTTVHDLVPLRLPALVPARHRWAVRCLLGGALAGARAGSSPCRKPRGPSSSRAIACPPGASWSCPRRRPRTSRPPRPAALAAVAAALRPHPPVRALRRLPRAEEEPGGAPRRPSPVSAAAARGARPSSSWSGAPGWGPDPRAAGPGAGPRRPVRVRRAGAGRRPARPLRRARLAFAFPVALGGLRAARPRGDGGRRARSSPPIGAPCPR